MAGRDGTFDKNSHPPGHTRGNTSGKRHPTASHRCQGAVRTLEVRLEVYRVALPSVDAVADRLVDVDIPVADLQVVTALGIGTNPGFIVDRSALITEVRKRNQVPGLALLTFWKI